MRKKDFLHMRNKMCKKFARIPRHVCLSVDFTRVMITYIALDSTTVLLNPAATCFRGVTVVIENSTLFSILPSSKHTVTQTQKLTQTHTFLCMY